MMKKVDRLTGHKGSIYCLTPDQDSAHFFSAGGDGWIARWPLEKGVDGKLIAEVDDQIFSLLQLPSSHLLAGTMSGNLYFIDPEQPAGTRNISYHRKGVFNIELVGGSAVCAGGDGRLSIWSIPEMELEETILLSHQSLRAIALTPDAQMLAVGSSDHKIYLLHIPSYRIIEVLDDAHANSVFTLQFSADGRYLVSGGRDAHLNIWDINSLRLVHSVAAHWYTVNTVRFRPGQKILATASRDKSIRLWEYPDLQLIQTLAVQSGEGHSASVNNLIWSHDGKWLVTASDDNTIIRWSD
ncbi:MAG: WD40 repeat domain-containing protein [Saprospiraceae bacterium]|nr:WD40 repeat domain-containing protein [Saprospiraceae bacterium]